MSEDEPPDEAHARGSDPHTSHEAAASLDSETLRQSQADVEVVLGILGAVDDTRLVTFYEQAVGAGLVRQQRPSGIRTRRRELVAKGRVADTGKRVVLDSGRHAIVWQVVR